MREIFFDGFGMLRPRWMAVLIILFVVAVSYWRFFTESGERFVSNQVEYRRQIRMRPYRAWCKLNGNPKKLTLEEWEQLKREELLPGQHKDDVGLL